MRYITARLAAANVHLSSFGAVGVNATGAMIDKNRFQLGAGEANTTA